MSVRFCPSRFRDSMTGIGPQRLHVRILQIGRSRINGVAAATPPHGPRAQISVCSDISNASWTSTPR